MSTYGNKPFGLRDVKITNIAGTVQADLPASQQFQLRLRLRSGELYGDDSLQAMTSHADAFEWTLGAGGIDLNAYAIMTGETVATAGSSPNEASTVTISAGDEMPYFKIYGKSMGDGTDDVHVKLFKCKISTLEGTFQDNQFFITSCSGVAIDDGSNGIIDIVQNETAADLPAS